MKYDTSALVGLRRASKRQDNTRRSGGAASACMGDIHSAASPPANRAADLGHSLRLKPAQ